MSINVEDLKLDIEELQEILSRAARPMVRDLVTVQLRKLQTQLCDLKERESQTIESTHSAGDGNLLKAASGKFVTRYTRDITTYGWDQSDAFMKIYVSDLNDVQKLAPENTTLHCTEHGFKLRVEDLNGKDHLLHISNLYGEIIPEESKHKVKTDMVLVMLKKKEKGKTWAYVTEQEKKSKEKKTPKLDEGADPQDSLMNMMKQMYEDGDDEMKRTISKAWYESRNKTPDL